MGTVGDILRTKGHDVWSIGSEATVYDALRLMAEENVGAVLVKDGDRVAGILSERDYARKVSLFGRSARDTSVREIMTERVICVRPDQSAQACMALMTDRRVRHLPVVKDDQVIGVVSIGDVVKSVLSEQEFIIEQLEQYIAGTPQRPGQPRSSD
jgi:CBS domain-containing protein